MTRLENAWADLERDGEISEFAGDVLARRVPTGAACSLFIGVGQPARERQLRLEVPSSAVPRDLQLPDAEGFDLDIEYDGQKQAATIIVRCSSASNHELFALFAESLVRAAGLARESRECIDALIQRIEVWRRFFRGDAGMLSADGRAGLVGELLILRDVMLPALGISGAVGAWTAGEGTQQDFACSQATVEVKSTRGRLPGVIRVSSERQLDPSTCGRLFLAVVFLHVTADGGISLPELVADIRNTVQLEASDALGGLDDRLAGRGYTDLHADSYQRDRYTVREIKVYSVEQHFPSVREKSLPTGVGDVTYALALAACEPYVRHINELKSALEEQN